MAEYYPDTIEVDSSNLSVITPQPNLLHFSERERMRLNSMEENYPYKVVVDSSNLSVATKLVRSSMAEPPAFIRRLADQGSSPCGPTAMFE
jgi:hypothetical protein